MVGVQAGLRKYSFSTLQITVVTAVVKIILEVEMEDEHWFCDYPLHAHHVLGAGDEQKQTQLPSLRRSRSSAEGR